MVLAFGGDSYGLFLINKCRVLLTLDFALWTITKYRNTDI